MDGRHVTEQDLRHPLFRHVKSLAELEFNDFGEIVRRDRFEQALQKLKAALYDDTRQTWFVETLTEDLRHILYYLKHFSLSGEELDEAIADLETLKEYLPECRQSPITVEVLLEDGTLLRNATLTPASHQAEPSFTLHWNNILITQTPQAIRPQSAKAILSIVQESRALRAHSTVSNDAHRASLTPPLPSPAPLSMLDAKV